MWVALLLADAAWLTDNDAAIRGVPAMSGRAVPSSNCCFSLQQACALAAGGPLG